MKKALYIITVIISILFVSSCSETNDFSSTDNINVSNINNYNAFLNSVDSINNMYLSNVTTTRGKGFTNYVLDKKIRQDSRLWRFYCWRLDWKECWPNIRLYIWEPCYWSFRILGRTLRR